MSCVIKYTHEDGKELKPYEFVLWCGKPHDEYTWVFGDAQHAALADKPICNVCRGNIIKSLRGRGVY